MEKALPRVGPNGGFSYGIEYVERHDNLACHELGTAYPVLRSK
jgi:hypothetical protein